MADSSVKFDVDGFFTGSPIDMDSIMDQWDTIRSDVKAIKGLLEKGASIPAVRTKTAAAKVAPVVTPATRKKAEAVAPVIAERKERGKPVAAAPVTTKQPTEKTLTNSIKQSQAQQTKTETARRRKSIVDPQRRAEIRLESKTLTNEFKKAKVAPALPQRDDKGRFTAKGGKKAGGNTEQEISTLAEEEKLLEELESVSANANESLKDNDLLDDEEGGGLSARAKISELAEKVGDSVASASSGMAEADPAVAAFKEVAEPMSRGLQMLNGFGQDSEKGWLKRIFRTLNIFKKEESTHNKAEKALLKDIKKKEGEGGSSSFFGGIAEKMGFAGGGMLAGSGLLAAGGLLGKLTKKIPVVGNVINTLFGIGKIFGIQNDSSLTDAQKRQQTNGAIGGIAGSWGGMLAGGKLGALAGSVIGPWGTVIGGAVGGIAGMFLGEKAGDIIGQKFDSWVAYLKDADIPTMISDGWNLVVETYNDVSSFVSDSWDTVKNAWTSATSVISENWEIVKDAFTPVADFIKQTFAPITDYITAKWDSVKEAFMPVVDYLKSGWDSVKETFSTVGDYLKSGWDTAISGLSGLWDSVKGLASSANDFIKEKTGIDIGGAIDSAIDKAGELRDSVVDAAEKKVEEIRDKVTPVVEKAKEKISDTIDTFVDAAKSVADKAQEGLELVKTSAGNAWDRVKENIGLGGSGGGYSGAYDLSGKYNLKDFKGLGSVSRRFESGGNAGTVAPDAGSWSYGMYQLNSGKGSVQAFLKNTKYGEQFKGLKVDSAEFRKKWKDIAQNDPQFAKAQYDYIKSAYYDNTMNKLKSSGVDFSKRGRAVQEAVWSSSVQYGSDLTKKMFLSSLKGKDINSLSDEQIVSLLQDYKAANNDKLFTKVDADTRAGVKKRIAIEKGILVGLARGETGENKVTTALAAVDANTANKPISVAANTPKMPTVPTGAKVEAAPKVQMPVGTQGDNTPQVVQIAGEVGQDVKDRNIAHIVTGGLVGTG